MIIFLLIFKYFLGRIFGLLFFGCFKLLNIWLIMFFDIFSFKGCFKNCIEELCKLILFVFLNIWIIVLFFWIFNICLWWILLFCIWILINFLYLILVIFLIVINGLMILLIVWYFLIIVYVFFWNDCLYCLFDFIDNLIYFF